jgi:hypothetical protein
MDEQEFDSWFPGRPFGREDAIQADARTRRCTALAVALWGNADYLQSQLGAPHPEIPSGFALADFRELQTRVTFQFFWSNREFVRRRFPMYLGPQHPDLLEARLEVLRRAIEYLENR